MPPPVAITAPARRLHELLQQVLLGIAKGGFAETLEEAGDALAEALLENRVAIENGTSRFLASRRPTVLLPTPGRPIQADEHGIRHGSSRPSCQRRVSVHRPRADGPAYPTGCTKRGDRGASIGTVARLDDSVRRLSSGLGHASRSFVASISMP
jgi:hypothetical protein